jgi:hypothetical protein
MTSQFLEFNPKSCFLPRQSPEEFKAYCKRFYFFKFLEQSNLFQSGDLCRFPVQSPDALGQGSINL